MFCLDYSALLCFSHILLGLWIGGHGDTSFVAEFLGLSEDSARPWKMFVVIQQVFQIKWLNTFFVHVPKTTHKGIF